MLHSTSCLPYCPEKADLTSSTLNQLTHIVITCEVQRSRAHTWTARACRNRSTAAEITPAKATTKLKTSHLTTPTVAEFEALPVATSFLNDEPQRTGTIFCDSKAAPQCSEVSLAATTA